jgi:hypothetical protein
MMLFALLKILQHLTPRRIQPLLLALASSN